MFYFFIPTIILVIVFTISFIIVNHYEPINKPNDLVGQKCFAASLINDVGGVIYHKGSPIFVRTYFGQIKKDEPVLVVGYSKDEDCYKVERYA